MRPANPLLGNLGLAEALEPGDACEFRFPARTEYRPGTVVVNGGPGYWQVRDDETGEVCRALYIEYVRAPGKPWVLT
jgi:hypothetical protein